MHARTELTQVIISEAQNMNNAVVGVQMGMVCCVYNFAHGRGSQQKSTVVRFTL